MERDLVKEFDSLAKTVEKRMKDLALCYKILARISMRYEYIMKECTTDREFRQLTGKEEI